MNNETNIDFSKILKASELISYQEQGVVSKTIVKRNSGTITLFAFDKGQSLSTHSAPYDALVEAIEGQIKIIISGKEFTLVKDEMILMPADQPHSVEALSRMKMKLTMIKEKKD